ncbi:MAG: hypothetical protein GY714_09165 [Desulfobacterales bacterium]|nr:hypothetical protein [Desulfobacterales bacterium]
MDLRQILDWRDRELSTSRSISQSLGVDFFLFHKKGRIKSFWNIIFKNAKCIYISHSIAQPRRDINNIEHRTKNPVPDKKRGFDFINSYTDFANFCGRFFSIIEPTWIDEFRFGSMENVEKKPDILKHAILPPLSERWPIGDGHRLGNKIDNKYDFELLNVDESVFKRLENYHFTAIKYAIAEKMLIGEIKRQINVRDHVLARQADIVFVYRPYISPFLPKPSGGVHAEISTQLKKRDTNGSDVRVIIYHPDSDEKRRKNLEFDKIWDEFAGSFFKKGENYDLFKEKCYNLILKHSKEVNIDTFRSQIFKLIEKHKMELAEDAKSNTDSAMAGEGLIGSNYASEKFVEILISEHVLLLKTDLENSFKDEVENGTIKFLNKFKCDIDHKKILETLIG